MRLSRSRRPAAPAKRGCANRGGSELDIRPLADTEVDSVVSLWRACDLLRPWNDPHADIARARCAAESELFVGRDADGGVVATVMCGHDGHRGWLYYLAVAPGARRRGHGLAMVRHAEAWLATRGCPKVQLMIREENAGVRGFYGALGYEVEPRLVMARRLER